MNTIKVENNRLTTNFELDIKDKTISLSNNDICIIYKDSNTSYNFIISNKVKIFEYFNNSKIDNVYKIADAGNLTLNRFSFDCSLQTSIFLEDGSTLVYKYSCLNYKNNNYVIDINHKKNSTSKIISNGLNMTDNKLDFIINCIVPKESINVNTSQDSKIILMSNNNSSIKPNLVIDNNDISANHACYIGHFKKNEMFYLNSRGINEKESLKLLAKSFLIGNMEIDFSCKHIILQDLNNNWR